MFNRCCRHNAIGSIPAGGLIDKATSVLLWAAVAAGTLFFWRGYRALFVGWFVAGLVMSSLLLSNWAPWKMVGWLPPAIVLIGYQAPHTLGRQIADRRPYLRIFDREYPLRAHVETLEGLSAHADVEDFKWWFAAMSADSHIGQAFLVHGEPESARALAEILRDYCDEDPVIPQRLETFDV